MTSSFSSKSRLTATIVTVLCIAVLTMALTLVLAGCGDKATLVGKWSDVDGVTVEFTADGKFIADDLGGVDATYVAEGGKITLSAMGAEVLSMEYTLDGDTLTVTDPDSGEVEKLTRVK